jgi:hypothetical protein
LEFRIDNLIIKRAEQLLGTPHNLHKILRKNIPERIPLPNGHNNQHIPHIKLPQQLQNLLPNLKALLIIIALQKLLLALGLRNENLLALFQSKTINELVVFEEVVVGTQVEDYFVDVRFGGDGRAERTDHPVGGGEDGAVDYGFC